MGKPERVDLFRLMRATKSLADQSDYLEYAALTFDLGLPSETKTVLAEGTSAGKIASGSADASALAKTAQDVISRDESLTSLTTKAKAKADGKLAAQTRSEEHTSELQSLMRISYAVFCLKKKTHKH